MAAVHHSKVKYTWLQSTIGSHISNSSRESSGQCWVTVNKKDGSVAERLRAQSFDTSELDWIMTTHLAASTDIWVWLLVAGFVALLILGFAFLIIEFPGLLDCLLYKDMPKEEGEEQEEVHRLTGRKRVKSRSYESSNYENVMRLSRQVSNRVRKISFKRAAEADEGGGSRDRQPGFVRKISRRMRGRQRQPDEESMQEEEEEEREVVREKKEGGFVRKLSNRMRRRTSEDGGQWMGRKSKEGGRRKHKRQEDGKSLATMEEGEELSGDNDGDSEEVTERKGSEEVKKEMLDDGETTSGTVGERAWTFVRSLSTRTKKTSGQSNEAPEIGDERNNIENAIEESKETEIHEENELDDRISENEDTGFQESKKVKGWARVRKISSSFRGSKASEPSPKGKKKKSKNIKGVVVPGKSKRRGSDFFKKTSRKGSYVDLEELDKRRKKGCAGIFPQVEVFGEDTDREGYEGDGEVTGAEEGKVYKAGLKEVEKGREDNCDTFKRPTIPDLVHCSDTTRTTL